MMRARAMVAAPGVGSVTLTACGALLVAAATAAIAATAGAQTLDLARVNGAVRDLRAVDIDGNAWSFEELRGRVVLIDFWATWCAPCRAEIPTMRQVVERYPDALVILGISLDRTVRREVVTWLNQQRVGWPQVHDGRGFGGDLARAFGIEQLPTSILIDHRGRVRAFTPRGKALVEAVDRLVAELRAEAGEGASPPTPRRTPTGSAGRRARPD